ncbi:unnamed protein product [Aphanomyces euteiches]
MQRLVVSVVVAWTAILAAGVAPVAANHHRHHRHHHDHHHGHDRDIEDTPANATLSTSDRATNPQCYLMPILLLQPTVPLPTSDCVQDPLPSLDCAKKTVATTLHVLHNKDDEWTCLQTDLANATTVSPRVRYRGDSSLRFNKHQLLLLFDEPTSLLGLPPDARWALHGPFIDGSLMRNHLAHWLYRNTGRLVLPFLLGILTRQRRYSPRTQHVALYMVNKPGGKPKYFGFYLLVETIGYGPQRVGLALNEPNCTDHSGGWAWQYNPITYGAYTPNILMDMYQGKFGMGSRPLLMYPPGESLSQAMRDSFVAETGFLPQLYRYLWHNMTSPKLLSTHLDIGSYVDYFLHTEWSLNQDAYSKSAFFFKDRAAPIEAGPVWDLNLAYGLGSHATQTTTWLYKQQPAWMRLVCNFEFASIAIARWKALRSTVWSNESVTLFIVGTEGVLSRNLAKCSNWMSDKDSCASVSASNQGSYVAQVALLKASLISRAQWMDANIESLYSKLSGDICGSVGDLPEYNCAEDGNDGGCIVNPSAYYTRVPIPPIRQPSKVTPCPPAPPATTVDTYNAPSIDPCWLSVGSYVTAGYITLTCSGHGTCPSGPNASCICNNKATTPDCATAVSLDDMPKVHLLSLWFCGGILLVLGAGVGITWLRNKIRRRHYSPISLDLKYGTE